MTDRTEGLQNAGLFFSVHLLYTGRYFPFLHRLQSSLTIAPPIFISSRRRDTNRNDSQAAYRRVC